MENLIMVGMILLLLFFETLHEIEKRAWRKERAQLLTRIMARTLPEFVEAEAKAEKEKVKVIKVDELMDDLKKELAPEDRVAV